MTPIPTPVAIYLSAIALYVAWLAIDVLRYQLRRRQAARTGRP